MKKIFVLLMGVLSLNCFASGPNDSDLKSRHARVNCSEGDGPCDSDLKKHQRVKSKEYGDLINVDEKNPHAELASSLNAVQTNDGPNDSDLKSRHARVNCSEGDGPCDSDLKKHQRVKK